MTYINRQNVKIKANDDLTSKYAATQYNNMQSFWRQMLPELLNFLYDMDTVYSMHKNIHIFMKPE